DWANPLVRPYMQLYPEEIPNKMSETWHADKLCKETRTDELSPMVEVNHKHFYINEVARCANGDYVYPIRWIFRNGELYGDVIEVTKDGVCPLQICIMSFIALSQVILIPLHLDNVADLDMFVEHPMRIKARGCPIYVCFLVLWGDDVSGNKTKQWNVHWNWYFAHGGLPKCLLQQEYFIRFASTSPHASNLEQTDPLASRKTHDDPIITWDSETQQEIMLIISVLHLPADNPMQPILASHIGLSGNCFCRKCKVGGSKETKSSDEGCHTLFFPGALRSVQETTAEITGQLQDTLKGLDVEDRQRKTGTKDSLTEPIITELLTRRKALVNKHIQLGHDHLDPTVSASIQKELQEWLQNQTETMKPLLSIPGLDPTQDTPTEPLYTILLGVIKYIWSITCSTIVEANNLSMLQARLTSVNTDGLGIPPLRAAYLVQYCGGLIGRQFKAIMQTMIFCIHDLVPPETMAVWRAAGRVRALLWYPEIHNVEKYLTELKNEIDILLDAMAVVDPSRIIRKPKFHILIHIVEDIRRFGPAILFSTEIFECFNAVFRMCSVLSNHQAPRRDIALKFGELDRFKHMVSGGYWKSENEWIHGSSNVRLFFRYNPRLQALLGWVDPAIVVPGLSHHIFIIRILIYLEISQVLSSLHHVRTCKRSCGRRHWVSQQFQHYFTNVQTSFQTDIRAVGCIAQILQEPAGSRSFIVIKKFTVGSQHTELEMPTLHKDTEDTCIHTKPKHILFIINVQHDCSRSGSAATAERPEVQEREETTRKNAIIEHQDHTHFIINLHALHNTHLLRKVLQSIPHLLYSTPVAEDRQQLHYTLADRLHTSIKIRGKATQEKREATKCRKEAEKGTEGSQPKKKQKTSHLKQPQDHTNGWQNISNNDHGHMYQISQSLYILAT
ncbi:hypothetical protein M422DRAFT_157275, partial [Sphaerobolus stellatus SS14]